MAKSSDLALSSTLRSVGVTFRLAGFISFWLKLVLAVISGVISLFAFSSRSLEDSGNAAAQNPTTGFGLLLVVLGVIFLGASVFWSFRYIQWGRRFLRGPAEALPSKAATDRLLRFAIYTDLLGMFFTVVGGEWVAGILIGKSFSQGFAIFNPNPNRIIEPIDLLVIQSCINAMVGQFVGLVASLGLLQKVHQPPRS